MAAVVNIKQKARHFIFSPKSEQGDKYGEAFIETMRVISAMRCSSRAKKISFFNFVRLEYALNVQHGLVAIFVRLGLFSEFTNESV